MCSWGGGGRQCLVLRGTRVPPSCKWEPAKRGRLPVPGGMRTPPGTGRRLPSYCRSTLVYLAMIFIIQIIIFILTELIPPGPGRLLSSWLTFCHHFNNDWLLSSWAWSFCSEGLISPRYGLSCDFKVDEMLFFYRFFFLSFFPTCFEKTSIFHSRAFGPYGVVSWPLGVVFLAAAHPEFQFLDFFWIYGKNFGFWEIFWTQW